MTDINFNDYNSWEKRLKGGDLIIFSSDKGGVSKTILCCERLEYFFNNENIEDTKYMHCGIILPHNSLEFKNRDDNKIYIMEALVSGNINDGIPNIETKTGKNGFQIRELKMVVEKFLKYDENGYVTCFTLNDCLFNDTICEDMKNNKNNKCQLIDEFWEEYRNSKYDFYQLYKSVIIFDCCYGNTKQNVFCSEIAVRFYQKFGYIREKIDCELISPMELGTWSGDLKYECKIFSDIKYILKNIEI